MKPFQSLAHTLHLSSYEAKIYIALQQDGPLLVRTIGTRAHIPRTAVYAPLANLVKRGLASETRFGKRRYYSAVAPQHLLTLFDADRQTLEQTIAMLGQTTNIRSLETGFETTFHTGTAGIKAAGLAFLHETKEKVWYSFENLARVTEHVGFDFEQFYVQQRVAREIRSKMILSVTEESTAVKTFLANDHKELRETVLLSPHQYPFQTTVVATKGLALLVNPNENPFALLIRNRPLADTFITLHKCLWDRYRIESTEKFHSFL